MTTVAPAPEAVEHADPGDIVHIACCVDSSIALCGHDVTHASWVFDGSGTECIVCGDLDDDQHCPLGGPCPTG